MADDVKYHILLLPKNDYWSWVNASRDYAMKFRVSLTPLPQNAVNFHRPEQIVSIANLPGGYPDY